MLRLLLLLTGLIRSDVVPVEGTEKHQPQQARTATVVVHRQPAVPIVALRMSLLAYDPPGFAGAGHMMQHVQYPSLRDRAARVGGRVQIQRTSDAIVYTVVGPATELSYLAQLLVSTLERPRVQTDAALRAERELREERLAEWETAPAHARSMLRAQVFPSDLSSAGTDRSATRFTPSALPSIWARMYQPGLISVVAVGDVYLTDVQNAFQQLPPSQQVVPSAIEQDSVILASLAPAEATRAWFGSAYLASDLPPAAVTVAARLVGDHIRGRLPSAQVDVEHWWTHHGQALAIIVAAPEAQMDAARRVVNTAVASVLDDLTRARLLDAATAVRREMLFYSRTPDRMADVIGQFIDREGDPNAAERFYADLDRVDEDDVATVLETMLDRTPARVEIPPQVLQERLR
jgi:predicted Zn-dependent peptidase